MSAIYLAESKVEAIMPEPLFRQRIASAIRASVSRTTLHRWREELGLSEPLTPEYAIALAFYGRCRRNRMSVDKAKQMTIQFCEEHGL